MAVATRVRRTFLAFRRSRGRLLGSLAVGWFLVLGMRYVVPALLPTIRTEYHISHTTAGLAVTVLWLTYAVIQFPTGALVDRIGERILLSGSMILSGLGLLVYGFSPVFALFLLATAVFGLATGLYGPTRGTVLSRCFPDREGTAFGTVLAAGSLGAAVLPFLAAVATDWIGWRIAFGLVAPAYLLVGAILWWTVPERETTPSERSILPDIRASLTAVRDRRLALAVVGATLMLFGFQAVTAFLTTFLVQQRGMSQGTAGGLLSLLFVGGAVAQTSTGALADRLGTPRVLAVVSALSVVPLIVLPSLRGTLALAVASIAIGIRMSSGPLSTAYVIDVLPDEIEGTAWGMLRTAFFAVGSFGSTVVGAMADRGVFAGAFYLLAVVTALAAVVFVFLPERAR
ncbi:MAG: nitrate/nitrite transporter [Halapricum sp.]